MKVGIIFKYFLSLSLFALLLVACAMPSPSPTPRVVPDVIPTPRIADTPTPAVIGDPPTVNIADTPTPPVIGTPTPVSLQTQSGQLIRQYAQPPAMTIDPDTQYTADIQTNQGTISVELFADKAPITVNNFVFLARQSFYDGVLFHRVIPNFMIQGGDPTGTGGGGPGYRFGDEIVPSLTFDRAGLLAMANAGPGTNGSQFFITVAPTPHLTGAHTIFGQVIAGQEVANAIAVARSDQSSRPNEEVIIQHIEIKEPN